MNFISLLGIAIALAMDAFTVAIAAGATLDSLTPRRIFRLSWHFGLFQALMPVLGWAAGIAVQRYIESFDHWIAFGLLAYVGIRMIWGSFKDEQHRKPVDPTKGAEMVMLSIATSIDALAVGLTLGMLNSAIATPAVIIGVVAAVFTIAGMFLGHKAGKVLGHRVEIVGGVILLAIGIKILVEHLS